MTASCCAGDSQHTSLIQRLLQAPLEVVQQFESLLDARGEASVTDAPAYYDLVSTRIRKAVDAALGTDAQVDSKCSLDPSEGDHATVKGLQDVFLLGVSSLLVFTQYNLTGSVHVLVMARVFPAIKPDCSQAGAPHPAHPHAHGRVVIEMSWSLLSSMHTSHASHAAPASSHAYGAAVVPACLPANALKRTLV